MNNRGECLQCAASGQRDESYLGSGQGPNMRPNIQHEILIDTQNVAQLKSYELIIPGILIKCLGPFCSLVTNYSKGNNR